MVLLVPACQEEWKATVTQSMGSQHRLRPGLWANSHRLARSHSTVGSCPSFSAEGALEMRGGLWAVGDSGIRMLLVRTGCDPNSEPTHDIQSRFLIQNLLENFCINEDNPKKICQSTCSNNGL